MLSGYVVSLSSAGALMAGAALVPWVLVALNAEIDPWTKAAAISAVPVRPSSRLRRPPSPSSSPFLAAIPLARPRERDRVRAAVTGFALGILLAAVQLIPAWYALRQSTRSIPDADFLSDWTLHPIRLLELFFPFPDGNDLEAPKYWAWFSVHGPSSVPFALSVYLGASTLLPAVAGLGRNRWTRFATTLILGGLLLALGTYVGLGALHAQIPPFRFFRYPEKYVLLASLGWAVLVGLGMELTGKCPGFSAPPLVGAGGCDDCALERHPLPLHTKGRPTRGNGSPSSGDVRRGRLLEVRGDDARPPLLPRCSWPADPVPLRSA